MPEDKPDGGAAPVKGRKSRRWLLLGAGVPVLFAGAAGVGAVSVPSVRTAIARFTGFGQRAEPSPPPRPERPIFVELAEMTVTLSNTGRQRQMRIKVSLELARLEPGQNAAEVLTPRLYDALLTYLRTLRDTELEGAIALDRLRGDLFRRIDLLLGPGVLRDVLVTSLVVS